MNSSVTIKNMSGKSGRSTQSMDSDNEFSDFSDQFNVTNSSIVYDGNSRIGKEWFPSQGKGVLACVLYGELFAVDGEYEIEWGEDSHQMFLSWTDGACNLDGEKGIVSDDGSGWGGWNNDEKCYLRYDRDILDDQEVCMKIIEIDMNNDQVVKKNTPIESNSQMKKVRKAESPKVDQKDVRKAESPKVDQKDVRKAERKVRKAESPKVDQKDVRKAERKVRKAERKVRKAESPKVDQKDVRKASNKSDSSKSDDDLQNIKGVLNDVLRLKKKTENMEKTEKTEEKVEATCVYIFTKGVKKNMPCGKKSRDLTGMCTKHFGKGKKIEITKQKGNKLSDMTTKYQNTQIMENVLSVVRDILSDTLKSKYAEKVNDVLNNMSDESQDKLLQVIKDNMQVTVVKTAKTSKAGKRKKDPKAPKRGCSSYIFYCKDARKEIKRDTPELKGTEVTTEIGRRWKLLSDKDKKPYIKLAEEAKAKYEEEKANYTPSDEWLAEEAASASDSDGGKKRKKSCKRKPGPKRALSAYIFFCKAKRSEVKEENTEMDSKQITSELGRMWREEYKENDKKNKPYIKLAQKDKKRYEKEKEAFVEKEESEKEESEKEESEKEESEKEESEKKESDSDSDSD